MDVMIDIETLDKEPSAVITSIGAVLFSPHDEEVTRERSILVKPSKENQLKMGRTVSVSTIGWWVKESPDQFLKEISLDGESSVANALNDLTEFCLSSIVTDEFYRQGFVNYWFHGPQFDCVKLESLYKSVNMDPPWNYNEVRDSRTLFSLLPEDPRDFTGQTAHDALDDAIVQARGVQVAFRKLNL